MYLQILVHTGPSNFVSKILWLASRATIHISFCMQVFLKLFENQIPIQTPLFPTPLPIADRDGVENRCKAKRTCGFLHPLHMPTCEG